LLDQPTVRQNLEAHLTTEDQSARRLVLAAVMMAIFMAAIDISIVATAMRKHPAEAADRRLIICKSASSLQ